MELKIVGRLGIQRDVSNTKYHLTTSAWPPKTAPKRVHRLAHFGAYQTLVVRTPYTLKYTVIMGEDPPSYTYVFHYFGGWCRFSCPPAGPHPKNWMQLPQVILRHYRLEGLRDSVLLDFVLQAFLVLHFLVERFFLPTQLVGRV